MVVINLQVLVFSVSRVGEVGYQCDGNRVFGCECGGKVGVVFIVIVVVGVVINIVKLYLLNLFEIVIVVF